MSASVDAAPGRLEPNASSPAAEGEQASSYWPVWRPGKRGEPRRLAAYVSPAAVRRLGLVADRGDVESADRPWADRQVAERLYLTLCDRGLAYAREPWVGIAGVQQVRDPRWLLEDGWGTCFDLATAYAAMCLEAHVGVLLAVVSRHVFVVATPGRLHQAAGTLAYEKLSALGGRQDPEEPGVWSFADRTALLRAADAGELVVIDPVAVTRPARDFADALAGGRDWLVHDGLILIDVPWLHTSRGGVPPLDPPSGRPVISLHVPGGQSDFVEYASHAKLIAELAGLSGTVALIGPPGQGKSTIARRLAFGAELGAGWFLNASEPQALINSLADADLAERNVTGEGLEQADRMGLAVRAQRRLAEATGRWVVVLDNADGDPAKLAPQLPRPGERQLVLITTTNREWERMPGIIPRPLPPLDAREVSETLGGSELDELVAGRALMLHAFKRFQQATGSTSAAIAACAPSAELGLSERLRGPATLWSAIRALPDFDAEQLEVSVRAAYLPPDHQPLGLLEQAADGAPQAVARLAERGLLAYEPEGRALRMHRLFGAAVRDEVDRSAPELGDSTVRSIATSSDCVALLDVHGDLDTAQRLGDRLALIDSRTSGADEALGVALHAVGELLELHGHSRPSGSIFALAERHLASDPERLAGSLLGQARPVYQAIGSTDEQLREALAMAQRASEIGNERTAGRAQAMQGLLMKRRAFHPAPGKTTLELLYEALDVLIEADRRRRREHAAVGSGQDEIPLEFSQMELARSRFNLAGIRVDLAKEEHRRAAVHLDEAAAIYGEVRDIRHSIYQRDVHPHIAACTIGLAYVDYYRATLLAALPPQRAQWLRAATDHAIDALRARSALDGSLDLGESRKCAAFLAKVALARHAGPPQPHGPRRAVQALADGVVEELDAAQVAMLPPDGRQPRSAIEEWARSPALARLVGEFGGEPPVDAKLAERLAWLEEFSGRWDYRAGVERNEVAGAEFSEDTRRVVLDAAYALGLIGTARPPHERYDHVLILGGLLRACFARPLHAAKLIREKVVATGSVVALGGYRPLRGDELSLVANVAAGGQIHDEFDAMDAGVRAAFGLGEPLDERGQSSDVVGESWRVREYETTLGADPPTGLCVRVVAAPSSEAGVRRANTADTYGWFASELVHLRPEDRVLVVTSDIYRPFQHADALRMLALPHGVEVDAVGIQPGDLDSRLTQTFDPHHYLQEIRSTIIAYRKLLVASNEATSAAETPAG